MRFSHISELAVNRFSQWCLVGLVAAVLCQSAYAAQIKAVRGEKYHLTKHHGPWMIMVASFKTPPKTRKSRTGMTPMQAADELVYELRKAGIPAYTYQRKEEREHVRSVDEHGRLRQRAYISTRDDVCVLAGNYKSADDSNKAGKVAHATLDWIEKKFQPKFLTEPDHAFAQSRADQRSSVRKLKSGGILRLTPGKKRNGLLSGAFLTLNPLLSPEEVQSLRHDPLLLKINTGDELSLLNNRGKYSVIVASFYGKSSNAQVGKAGMDKFMKSFNQFKISKKNNQLTQAAYSAWELATSLRQGHFFVNQGTNPRSQKFDAWVFHDRFRSVVTVGSFDRPDDPRIKKIQETFRAKLREHKQTRRQVLTAEQLTIPAKLAPGQTPSRMWIFDPSPQLIRVPKFQ